MNYQEWHRWQVYIMTWIRAGCPVELHICYKQLFYFPGWDWTDGGENER